jgi:hypothetical protein
MKHCPKCNSLRVQTAEHVVTSYRCLSCGWIEIGDIKLCVQSLSSRRYLRTLFQSGWLYVVFVLAALVGGYLISAEVITPGTYFAFRDTVSLFSEKAETEKEIASTSGTTEAPVILEPPTRAAPSLPKTSSLGAENASLRRTDKVDVVANTKSKRYHLPGMKYYDKIPMDRRVIFTSEEAARKAGYRKSAR